MDSEPPASITKLLSSVREGDTRASDSLLELAYAELGRLASIYLARERRDHTLQPTALVHEAWMKLGGKLGGASDRAHFFAIASQAMRRILTDHARGRSREKRGGDRLRVTLDEALVAQQEDIDYAELDDTLALLAQLNERHARVVELRVFGGLTIAETAEVLAVSHTTVENDWFTARAWLRTQMGRAS